MSGGSDLTASARPQFVPSPNIFPMAHQNQFRPRPQPAWENFQVPMAMEADSTPQLPPQYQPSPLPQQVADQPQRQEPGVGLSLSGVLLEHEARADQQRGKER